MRAANICTTSILILGHSLVQAWISTPVGLFSRSPRVKFGLNIFQLRSAATDASNNVNDSAEIIGSKYLNYVEC